MILEKIQLEPFAGFVRKEIDFKPGLNVVLGPNDVGKSSLFRAIESAFLLPAKVRANTLEGKGLKRLIPFGGDHARVRLQFSVEGKTFQVEKNWGANFSSRLRLPEGKELTSAEAVEAKLAELLPAPTATFQSVLLTPQNTLERTKEELESRPDSLHTLGDALRQTVDLAGGVSVDRLKNELATRREELLENWDVATGAPRGMRGIENPWQKGVGTVLAAYYQKEELRKQLSETLALELELGEKLKSLAIKQGRLEEGRVFLRDNQASVDAVAARAALEAERRQTEKDLQEVTRDFSAWVQAESDRKLLEGEVARLEGSKQRIDLEWKGVRAGVERKNFLAKFEKVLAAKEKFQVAEAAFASLPAIRGEEMKKILQLGAAVAQAKAGRLKIQFTAKNKMDLRIRKNSEPERAGTIEAGGSMTIQSGAKVQIQSDAFDLVVTSGEGKISDAERDNSALAAALEKVSVKSVEEAQEKHEKWLAASLAQREADSLFKALLGKEEFAALEQRFRAEENIPRGREPETVEKEFQEINSQYAEKKGALAVAQRLLAELGKRHAVTEANALARILGKKTADTESLGARLQGLPPLPSEISDSVEYVAKYRRCQNEQPGLAEEVRLISNSVADLKARMPAESAQEFDRLHREAIDAFNSQLRKAKALLRVEEVVGELEQNTGDVYQDFRASFERFVSELSGGKYAQAKMLEAIPSEFRRKDGADIPFEWLSAGTKDAFALALRLSMAKHFLGKARGFLLIDDPMVAMDPVRQRTVAELLRSFADGAQTVVFTCHPAHAELLGGHLIELAPS